MKVIFLDIDGVLNNKDSDFTSLDHTNWIREAVQDLDNLCNEFGTKAVISSSWRMIFPDIAWWNAEFAASGAKYIEVIGITESAFNGFRGREVREYLTKNPEIESYLILDDDCDFYDDQPRVKTNFQVGLTLNDYSLARAILEGRTNGLGNYCLIEWRTPAADNIFGGSASDL